MAEPRVVTLGCRVNAFESEIIRREAAAAGLDDTVIVNTCAVTAEAVRQARQTIRRLRRQHPDSRIIVTGCAAQITPAAFSAMPEVDRVLGNVEKLDRTHLAASATAVAVSDIDRVVESGPPMLQGFDGRSRAFAQIQQGCDHRCTYCIIPFARGANRSVPPDRIIEQVRTLAVNGYGEVVLTGVDICSYGRDRTDRDGLGLLVRRLLAAVPELRRLRLSTLDPAAVDDELIAALADEPRLMPHWHLSLQAADDMILKRMRRRHTRASAFALVERARRARPGIVFGADLIAGFPTESEAMFANTLTAVSDLGLTYLHVFPFSARPGTPAARMPQVPRPVREERAARLRAAGDRARRAHFAARIGTNTEVLVEQANIGRTADYAPVRLTNPSLAAQFATVHIHSANDDHLVGDILR
jgi:threonylcarbamoyladenosine tRNA methylthiotransferase MtaB